METGQRTQSTEESPTRDPGSEARGSEEVEALLLPQQTLFDGLPCSQTVLVVWASGAWLVLS